MAGAGEKAASLMAAGVGPSRLTKFLSFVADANVINAVKSSPPAVMSGIAGYLRFCTLPGRPASPDLCDRRSQECDL